MAIWSVSQKRYIDTPSTGGSAPVSTTSNTDMTSIGIPDEAIRNAFFRLTAANPKQKDTYKAMYDYIKPDPSKEGSTPAEKSRAKTGIQAIDQINSIPERVRNKTGTWKAFSYIIKGSLPGGIGMPFISGEDDEDIANLDQQYFMLTQAVMTAIQGSRPSDYDVRSYQQKAGPNIRLSNKVNQQRIINLKSLMEERAGVSPVNNMNVPKSSPWEIVR